MGFQFKKDLAEKILGGKKTQTRRPDKEGDFGNANVTVIYRNGRKLWAIGQRYAIQPGRGKKGVGFLEITNIRNEDVRFISREDAIAEGFESELEFLQVWVSFYDPRVKLIQRAPGSDDWRIEFRPYEGSFVGQHVTLEEARKWLCMRPNELYRAHVIDFKLVSPEPEETAVAS